MKLRVAKKVLLNGARHMGSYYRAMRRYDRWEKRVLLAWPRGRGWVAVRIEVAS